MSIITASTYNWKIDKRMVCKLVWLHETSSRNSYSELFSDHGESSNTILVETAGASGSRLAMFVTHDHEHATVKLSSMFDCDFSLETA